MLYHRTLSACLALGLVMAAPSALAERSPSDKAHDTLNKVLSAAENDAAENDTDQGSSVTVNGQVGHSNGRPSDLLGTSKRGKYVMERYVMIAPRTGTADRSDCRRACGRWDEDQFTAGKIGGMIRRCRNEFGGQLSDWFVRNQAYVFEGTCLWVTDG